MNARKDMADLVAGLAEQARALPAEERARLIDLVLESLREPEPGDVAAAWEREIERRVAAHASGKVETYAAADVFRDSRQITS
jgi:putative addiction module component (TIGR02574 family)